MKIRNYWNGQRHFSSISIHLIRATLIFMLAFVSSAQEVRLPQTGTETSPKTEKFVAASALMIPHRSLGATCWALTPNPKPDCKPGSLQDWQRNHFLTLYNADGSIWFSFSVDPQNPDHFVHRANKGFRPLGPTQFTYASGEVFVPDLVVLRLSGESPNWYQVEVNEDSLETKFVSKGDPSWAKVGWDDVFNMSFNVYINPAITRVFDKPEGNAILECSKVAPTELQFGKLDGDWMLVNEKFPSDETCRGWIRWRKGRQILVGSILNGRKAVEAESN